jgi:hypothetical protein
VPLSPVFCKKQNQCEGESQLSLKVQETGEDDLWITENFQRNIQKSE